MKRFLLREFESDPEISLNLISHCKSSSNSHRIWDIPRTTHLQEPYVSLVAAQLQFAQHLSCDAMCARVSNILDPTCRRDFAQTQSLVTRQPLTCLFLADYEGNQLSFINNDSEVQQGSRSTRNSIRTIDHLVRCLILSVHRPCHPVVTCKLQKICSWTSMNSHPNAPRDTSSSSQPSDFDNPEEFVQRARDVNVPLPRTPERPVPAPETPIQPVPQ